MDTYTTHMYKFTYHVWFFQAGEDDRIVYATCPEGARAILFSAPEVVAVILLDVQPLDTPAATTYGTYTPIGG